ncbi:Maf-like protein [Mycobacterium sp. MYCO198283]|uniref:Maf family protein n=1 Tax=Mycobacterium sp. MYCO198283 TaxID=2883505 RepID=UPI001E3CA406|nr:Maf family protein [Mycobacterium sp. MYCO198283]MCG5431661.1 Maf-like protein [Mycobacterium sp. MYCO198283]
MTRVVLGSASAGRLGVLRQAGIAPLVVVSGVDEDAVMAAQPPGSPPGQVTTALATAKADAVAGGLTPDVAADCVVIGCDSMLSIDGELRGKPGSAEAAHRAWGQLAGRSGALHTGHCVIRLRGDEVARAAAAAVTWVRFGTPSPADLDAYVASGEPLGVAGGFTIDGRGGWFVDGVDGDPSSVVGIGLPTVRRLFEATGLSLAGLWRDNPVP